MTFCGVELMPGQKVRVPLPVSRCSAVGYSLPVRHRPRQDAGGHAGSPRREYVGVQALRRLAAELDPAELSGNVIFLPLANPTRFLCWGKAGSA